MVEQNKILNRFMNYKYSFCISEISSLKIIHFWQEFEVSVMTEKLPLGQHSSGSSKWAHFYLDFTMFQTLHWRLDDRVHFFLRESKKDKKENTIRDLLWWRKVLLSDFRCRPTFPASTYSPVTSFSMLTGAALSTTKESTFGASLLDSVIFSSCTKSDLHSWRNLRICDMDGLLLMFEKSHKIAISNLTSNI